MELIGRLQIEQLLGSGSFASVWLAYDPDLDSRVAIKVLADNWAQDPDMRSRFTEEARILRRLEHARVARVYAIDTLSDGRPYLVMEHADRGSLFDRINTRHSTGSGFSVDEAMSISLELADCVSVAHDLGVIHRDLKPSNILYRTVPAHHQAALRRRGLDAPAEQMLLVDFGLARKFQALTESTIAAGTPHYMAPEQAEGRADARVDVYACAAILYQLLAGEVPYPFSSIGEVIRRQLIGEVPSILDRRPDAGLHLDEILRSGLAVDPTHRPRSIAEWTDALSEVQTGFRPTPMRTKPEPPTTPTEAVVPSQQGPSIREQPEQKRDVASSQPPTEVSQDPAFRPIPADPMPEPEPEPKPKAEPEPEPELEPEPMPGQESEVVSDARTCEECGAENPADYLFCAECGIGFEKAVEQSCPECGHKNPADFAFCGECGTGLAGT